MVDRAPSADPDPARGTGGSSDAIERWLVERGARVTRDGPSIDARIGARIGTGGLAEADWRVERASLLVRYLDRRVAGRRLTCELMRVQTSLMHEETLVMRCRIAELRAAVAAHAAH